MKTSFDQIRLERRFARQFVTAGVLIIVVFVNLSLYVSTLLERMEEAAPMAFLIQLGFIPILLGFMGYYFFRLYRFRITQLRESEK